MIVYAKSVGAKIGKDNVCNLTAPLKFPTINLKRIRRR